MDEDQRKKLEELKERGELDEETYNEILRRWESDRKYEDHEPGKESPDGEKGRGERTNRVSVSGSGNLSDVYAKDFSVSGSVNVGGYLDADSIIISGSCHVQGEVKSAQMFEISGSARITGGIDANVVETSGLLKADSIKCRKLEISGSLSVLKMVVAEEFEVSGMSTAELVESMTVKVYGALDAETIEGNEVFISGKIKSRLVEAKRFEMKVFGTWSEIDTLDADVVEISPGRRRLMSRRAKVNTIKCKRASLEGVSARSVTGDEVIIGDNCDIDYLEARNMKISDKARVREKKVL